MLAFAAWSLVGLGVGDAHDRDLSARSERARRGGVSEIAAVAGARARSDDGLELELLRRPGIRGRERFFWNRLGVRSGIDFGLVVDLNGVLVIR